MNDILLGAGTRGAAWLATYLVHSTVLLGLVLVLTRLRPRFAEVHANRLWKAAAVAGVITASLTAGTGLRPLLGSVDVPGPVQAMHVVREMRTVIAGAPGEVPKQEVRREEQIIRPGSPQPAHLAAGACALFLVVATARGARLLARRRTLARTLRDRTSVASHPEAHELVAWLSHLPELRGVRVSVSPTLPGPVALGRREICLPARILIELGTAEQRSIVAHEAAHLLRRDPLWLTTLGWIEALFFVQPLNTLALTRFKRSAEILCDDWAVSATGRPIALARSIATVAGWVRTAAPVPVPAMTEAGVSFVGRIERLVEYQPPARDRRTPLALSAALAVVLATPFALPAVHARGTASSVAEHRVRLHVDPGAVREWAGPEPLTAGAVED